MSNYFFLFFLSKDKESSFRDIPIFATIEVTRSASMQMLFYFMLACFFFPPPSLMADGENFKKADSLIYFIGDGMGPNYLNATRTYFYQANNHLHMETLPITGIVKTYSADNLVTDSAAAATALASGIKTKNGAVGLLPDLKTPVTTLLDWGVKQGKRVGIVTTTRITHATPAAFYAHVDDRDKEEMIARQLLDKKIDLLLGGGRSNFFPPTWIDPEEGKKGLRTDQLNIISLLQKQGYYYVESKKELNESLNRQKLIGLFQYDHMNFEKERASDKAGEPSLSEMVSFAIDFLSNSSPNGYILIVEGGRIDHAGHANKSEYALTETWALDQAVAVAIERQKKNPQTLIAVTADHETGGLVVNGESTTVLYDGSKLLSEGKEGEKLVSWASGPGDPQYQIPSAKTTKKGEHSASDVLIFVKGPKEELFSGVMENSSIPLKLANALALPIDR